VSPSWAAESSAVIGPYANPRRETGRVGGGVYAEPCVIDSWPPARTTTSFADRIAVKRR